MLGTIPGIVDTTEQKKWLSSMSLHYYEQNRLQQVN